MTPSSTQEWYALLEKPWFAPPAWIFGPVWSALYVLIIISFGFVFLQVLRGRWPRIVAVPFAINLVANLLFTPIQFGLRNNILALIDIMIVLCTILWMMRVTWQRARWVSYIQCPYLLWVSFATVLQMSVTWMNS
jgi:tryptophan-rich sensory protein